MQWDKFDGKITHTSPAHAFSFGWPAWQGALPHIPQLSAFLAGLRLLQATVQPGSFGGSYQAPSLPKHCSRRLCVYDKVQFPLQISSLQSMHSNSQHCHILSCFLQSGSALSRESYVAEEPHAYCFSKWAEHSDLQGGKRNSHMNILHKNWPNSLLVFWRE